MSKLIQASETHLPWYADASAHLRSRSKINRDQWSCHIWPNNAETEYVALILGDSEEKALTNARLVMQAVNEREELLCALKVAHDRLLLIAGSFMAIAHGDPEADLHKAIETMGKDMRVVSQTLSRAQQPDQPKDV